MVETEAIKGINFVYGNMAWNAGLVALCLWCVRKLYFDILTRIDNNAKIAEENAKVFREAIEKLTEHISSNTSKTTEIEGSVQTIKAVCAERHKSD